MLTPLNAWLTDTVFAGRDLGSVIVLCLLAFLANLVPRLRAAGLCCPGAGRRSFRLCAAGERTSCACALGAAAWLRLYCRHCGRLLRAAMILANALMSAWLYARYPWLRPRAGDVDHGLRPVILGVGLQLFIVQLCALIAFFDRPSHR